MVTMLKRRNMWRVRKDEDREKEKNIERERKERRRIIERRIKNRRGKRRVLEEVLVDEETRFERKRTTASTGNEQKG